MSRQRTPVEMIERALGRHSSDIEQECDFGIQDVTDGVEKPTMGIDLH